MSLQYFVKNIQQLLEDSLLENLGITPTKIYGEMLDKLLKFLLRESLEKKSSEVLLEECLVKFFLN